MEKASVAEIDAFETGDEELDRRTLRPLTAAVGAESVAVNHYTLKPGEAFSSRLHTHLDQEETFYIIEGRATFRTEDGTVEVGPDEAIRFAPGEFQRGRNDGDEVVRALAFGAPGDSTEIRVREACGACGETDALAVGFAEDGMVLRCPECGAESES